MANRNYVSKTVEISVERFSQLVADETTLANVKKIVGNGRFVIKSEDLINSLKYMLQEPEKDANEPK